MSGHADTIHGALQAMAYAADRKEKDKERIRLTGLASDAARSLDALLAENQRYEKLLRDVLPHLEGGHDEVRIWAQNVREALAGDTE